MDDGQVVHTHIGKYHKYEIIKRPGGVLSSTKFVVHKDGKSHRGPYSRLDEAVEAAEEEK